MKPKEPSLRFAKIQLKQLEINAFYLRKVELLTETKGIDDQMMILGSILVKWCGDQAVMHSLAKTKNVCVSL